MYVGQFCVELEYFATDANVGDLGLAGPYTLRVGLFWRVCISTKNTPHYPGAHWACAGEFI